MPPEQEVARGRVWVVDDSPLERQFSERALSRRFDVRTFDGGTAMLESLTQDEHPDLVVLDWQMPNMSGREVCLFLRESTSAARLPILVLTGSGEALVEALDAGANDYVSKPFRPEELNARAASLVALRRAHAKLVDTEQRLRTEGEFRERFVGILAHDLRQPLNTIVMSAGLREADEARPAAPSDARVLRAAQRMSRMIDEILDFTRGRVGQGIPVTRVDGDLLDVVRRAVDERSERLMISVTSEGDTRGRWDADRMAQVCGNLLGNAIDYGAPGRPISVRVRGSARDVVLEVHNEGAPIASSDIQTLFDPFRRGAASSQARTGAGLGLGLFIADQVVRSHGGTLTVVSGDEGTTFIARLPAREA